MCTGIIGRECKVPFIKTRDGLATPDEIKKVLDNYVVGQDHAKMVISAAIHNHFKRLLHQEGLNDLEISKSNVLMIGPIGTGKTLLAQTLARILDVPFVIVDATTLLNADSSEGAGKNLIRRLLDTANFNIERAQRGIVCIDHIDAIARKPESPSTSRNVLGEEVQQSLLKLMEGTIVELPNPASHLLGQSSLGVDTTNILFICGGSFTGIEKPNPNLICSDGLSDAPSCVETRRSLQGPHSRELFAYGLIPGLVARLSVVANFEPHDEASLRLILTQPVDALVDQYRKLFEMETVDLVFNEDALTSIAQRAFHEQTGAWGLRAIMDSALGETMSRLPSLAGLEKVVISKDVIEGMAMPQLVFAKNGERN